MTTLHEQILAVAPMALAWGGFIIGAIFGLVVQLTNFCAMGSLSDVSSFGDYRRLRAWLLASAVALVGAQGLHHFAVVDLERSMYLGTSFNWSGNILGGALFGIGMVFAGGCASRNLVRLGSGDLRSGVVLLVMGLFAYMTVGGILGPLRAALEHHSALALPAGSTQALPSLLAVATGASSGTLSWVVSAVVAGGLFVYCFAAPDFRRSPRHVIGGLAVGLCVVAGWALTGLAYDEFADMPVMPQSLSYVRPTGDTMEYLQRFTANTVPAFGVATVFGALAGATLGALLSGKFRLAGFADAGDTWRNLAGGALMGIGGVTALGCTIGQSVTGISTLAIGSFATAAALIAGGFLGLRLLEQLLST